MQSSNASADPGEIALLRVSVAAQTLSAFDASGCLVRAYPVSTSRFGLGTLPGSLRTPLGRFRVAEKIGDGQPIGTVFAGRVPDTTAVLDPDAADLILTRILWLEGLDEENANTRERYIYIHGTNQEALIGQPASHGCVRMRNADVLDLFDRVAAGVEVRIELS